MVTAQDCVFVDWTSNIPVRTEKGSQLQKALSEIPRDGGRLFSSEHPWMHFAFLLLDKGGISKLWFTRCGGTASRLDFALYGSFLPVLMGHFVKSQQGAAAGQRLCKAEFAEGRLHAAVTDAVVSDLVYWRPRGGR